MMGGIEASDIRWSTLTEANRHAEPGEEHHPYTPGSCARAVRDGLDPAGERLSRGMPRWDLGDDEVQALLAYLETL